MKIQAEPTWTVEKDDAVAEELAKVESYDNQTDDNADCNHRTSLAPQPTQLRLIMKQWRLLR